jgi:hypothetical protein
MDRSDHRQAEILDTCLTRLMSGSASSDELLHAYPGDEAWLKPLLLAAETTRHAMALPAMPAEKKLAGERRIRAHIRSQAVGRAPSRGRRLRPAFAMVSIALVLALLGSVSGIAYAAEASLPGDVLYPVKQVIEQTQLSLSQTAEDEAKLLVRFSEERLREAEQLSAKGRPEGLPVALEGYGRAVGRLMELADQLPEQNSGEALQTLAGELRRQAEVLSRIRDRAPEAAQPGLQQAVQQSTRTRERVEQMLETRSHEGGPPAERGKQATPAASQTPSPAQEKDKDSGKGQGRGRPTEIPSG